MASEVQIQGGGRWNLQSVAGWSEAQVITWAYDWCLKWVRGGSPVGLSPQFVESDVISG